MPTQTTAAFRLTLDVLYDLNGECPRALAAQMRRVVQQAAIQGMLSGHTDANVKTYSIRVESAPVQQASPLTFVA